MCFYTIPLQLHEQEAVDVPPNMAPPRNPRRCNLNAANPSIVRVPNIQQHNHLRCNSMAHSMLSNASLDHQIL